MPSAAQPETTVRLHGIAALGIDLDGTLIDSAPDLAWAANTALTACALPPLPEQQLRGMIGDGIQVLLRRALTAAQGHDVSDALLAQARPVMLAAYRDNLFQRSVVYPGVLAALQRWREQGMRLTCITNKMSSLAQPLLEQSGLLAYFEALYCADRPEERKPAPVLIKRALVDLQLPPQRFLMIGDSTHDLHAAQAAGARGLAVRYGYCDGQLLAATGGLLVAHLDEVVLA
jgi:phosphoglycolate phosphatase